MRSRLALLGTLAITTLGVASLSVATSGCATASPAPATASTTVVSAATLPTAPLVTLGGERTDLARVAEGRVALVSFWATWCEACTKELDALNRLSQRAHERSDAMVIGVAVGETPGSVDGFARAHGLAYVQLVDEGFLLADALGQRHVPATIVLDRRGRVVYRGDALGKDALEAFRRALGEARP